MKKVSLLLIAMFIFFGFKAFNTFKFRNINSVEISTIIKDSLLNVRALEIIENTNVLVFLTSNGNMGVVPIEENGTSNKNIAYPIKVKSDSISPNFRALAGSSKHGYGLSIGSPALLFKLDIGKDTVVYRENHPKTFYDSMDFWNNQEGIAIGDPTNDCMSIIITRDGGETWHKLPCDSLPKVNEGEAAFAASDTNIAIVGNHTWVATGGKSSRILYSPDKGKTWKVYNTPIVQGLETTGMYSIDFYDELNGFAIGGDYTKPEDNAANKIKTIDGGKTWELVAQNKNPGYRSCVQYIPNRGGKELVAVGFKGIDYSNDSGNSWKHLNDEGFYTIRFLNDSIAYAAGAGSISKLTFRE
ncbi:WD40/YVTN/BNR-like repeat-containing protein [Flavivirga algicola]|uniref:Oxidoreductase n=1 Tax=Flavivirga algicola TaxID=2729136 RepID=A0ABX1RW22_9FLAO|nr:oxidoreductase [Flavivirga algicola]NMH86694.1 oxidoreductase [Flavivirga algicola]